MARHVRKKRRILPGVMGILLAFALAAGALYFTVVHLGQAGDFMKQSAYPLKYSNYVEKASRDYGLSSSLIYAVIHTESGFDPDAESKAGAKGLMQIMPESFRWMQQLRGESLSDDKLTQPGVNIDYGCFLLKYFNDLYGNIYTAVAAYNAGFVVSDWLEDSSLSTDGKTLESIPYGETSHYVKKVKSTEAMYNKLYFSEN